MSASYPLPVAAPATQDAREAILGLSVVVSCRTGNCGDPPQRHGCPMPDGPLHNSGPGSDPLHEALNGERPGIRTLNRLIKSQQLYR